MKLRFVEGPAGSGKTTHLMQDLSAALTEYPLREQQRVLALTRMHGSRRRLKGRLAATPKVGGRFDSTTVDSFAWRLLHRWRSLARSSFGEMGEPGDYSEICRRAGSLLQRDYVCAWVARRYPLLIIDELQDSKDGQLVMVQALAQGGVCLAAGDDFQDLEADGENAAVLWARRCGETTTLVQCQRTEVAGLLAAAKALREGQAVAKGQGFSIESVPSPDLGAWFVSSHLTRWFAWAKDIAIITPVGAERAPFVRELLARVGKGPIGKKWRCGPFSIPWESSTEQAHADIIAQLALPDDPEARVGAQGAPRGGSVRISWSRSLARPKTEGSRINRVRSRRSAYSARTDPAAVSRLWGVSEKGSSCHDSSPSEEPRI